MFRLIILVEILHAILFKVSYDMDIKTPTGNLVYGKLRLNYMVLLGKVS